jgi:predicted DNA-binding transcriptional regulator YafY
MPKLNPLSEEKRIERILEIVRLISTPRSALTIDDLADEFHVDRRSIQRDLALLSQTGFDFSADGPKQGRKKVLKFIGEQPLSVPYGFTEDELSSLYLTQEIYSILKGSHFEKAAESAIRKIEPFFNEEKIEKLRSAVRVKTGPVRDYSAHRENIKLLLDSIVDRDCVKIAYDSRSSGKFDTFVLQPYTLIFYANTLYVTGFSEKHQAYRIFAAERVGRVERAGRKFEMPEDLDDIINLEKYFGIYSGEAETVVIRVLPSHRKWMKDKILHPTQKRTFPSDGSMLITLKAAGKEDLFRWLLSQADAVELLEPASWVDEFKSILGKIQEVYGKARYSAPKKTVFSARI